MVSVRKLIHIILARKPLRLCVMAKNKNRPFF
jgi:hypothetical protein